MRDMVTVTMRPPGLLQDCKGYHKTIRVAMRVP